MQYKIIVFVLMFFVSKNIIAQQLYLPLNHDLCNQYNRFLNATDVSFHTSIRPYLESEVNQKINFDSLMSYETRHSEFLSKRKYKWFWKKLLKENLIRVKTDDFKLTIDPLFNFGGGYDVSAYQEKIITNTRGLQINGSINYKFSFSSSFLENQTSFPFYIDTFIKYNKVVPGQGARRKFQNFQDKYDYASVEAYISYTPSKYFNFNFGHGKNFIGDGYRSLLLSDNAYSYPFLKITTNVWKLKYVNLFAQFQTGPPTSYNLLQYQKKYATFHYLNWEVNRRFQFGLFDAIVWQAEDSSNKRGFDVNYLNPVIFLHEVNYDMGSPDNSIFGLNAKYKINNSYSLYGQFMLDDFNFYKTKKGGTDFFQDKFGYQVGFKAYDIFGIKKLNLQSEYNQVRPYTFAHKIPLNNYAHYNQALAHPLGANFRESVSFINYSVKDFTFRTELLYAVYGADSPSGKHFGQNIFVSDYDSYKGHLSFGNEMGQGISTRLKYLDFRISYLLNPKTNMKLEVGVAMREKTTDVIKENSNFVYIGFRTALSNIYYDF